MRLRAPDDPGLSHGNRSFRWGDQRTLTFVSPSATLIATPTFAIPKIFLLEFDFPDSGIVELITITIRRAVDELGSVVEEQFVGFSQPEQIRLPKYWIGHNFSLDVRLDAPTAVSPSVSFAAACSPVCYADATAFLPFPPQFGPLGGYGFTQSVRFPAVAVNTLLRPANVSRRQFFIQNNSTQDLAVLFGAGVPSLVAGAENYAILLPGGSFSHYESPIGGYTGEIRGIWRAADAAGEALITEGLAP